MQTEKEEKKDSILRCVDCRKEFALSYIEEIDAKKCPSCGTSALPMDAANDIQVKINWHELRILCIWAKNWQEFRINKDADTNNEPRTITIDMIISELEKQRPENAAPLTILGELKQIAEMYNTEVSLIDINGETIIPKKLLD